MKEILVLHITYFPYSRHAVQAECCTLGLAATGQRRTQQHHPNREAYTPEDPKERDRSGREMRRLWYRSPEMILREEIYGPKAGEKHTVTRALTKLPLEIGDAFPEASGGLLPVRTVFPCVNLVNLVLVVCMMPYPPPQFQCWNVQQLVGEGQAEGAGLPRTSAPLVPAARAVAELHFSGFCWARLCGHFVLSKPFHKGNPVAVRARCLRVLGSRDKRTKQFKPQ